MDGTDSKLDQSLKQVFCEFYCGRHFHSWRPLSEGRDFEKERKSQNRQSSPIVEVDKVTALPMMRQRKAGPTMNGRHLPRQPAPLDTPTTPLLVIIRPGPSGPPR